ncbi:energy-coupling factor transporter ATPase [Aquibacillus koreensis]|uniref:Energy-coupling factor transporter ATPase n=1 Tax=Aquibacillus koreensis TaxID=279446 RepID=A0A9X3WPI8_9BACI|nr:energy-coupling factor transporter ATPase [Aquibacillus koreensis]MCT2534296.1 energy-coupling factor transporter ATPase [Aquibacillus koreensis]MDC3422373.1 energy-coupling factor transporter ATPase [Aquibacillus koreensis]
MLQPIIEVNNLTFQYDQRLEDKVLSDVSFSVQKGEWLAIVGSNGSGKSTLAQLLVGLYSSLLGSIHINGIELNETSKWEVRKQIGIVFQNPDNQFIGSTVQDDVAFGLENINMPYEEMQVRVEKALELVGMTDMRLYDPSRLSGGQKQRVAIAGILALKPSVIVMDEAFVMLDPKSRRSLLNTLHQLKEKEQLTIISITHDMDEAATADRMLLLEAGKVKEIASPRHVFQQHTNLEPPFAERLRRKLSSKGASVPSTYMTEKELVQWLWK